MSQSFLRRKRKPAPRAKTAAIAAICQMGKMTVVVILYSPDELGVWNS